MKQAVKIFVLFFLSIVSLLTQAAHAKTTRWTATGPGNWSDSANWDNGVPAAGDLVEFDSTGNGNSTIDQVFSIGALNMAAGGAYTGTLTIPVAAGTLTVTGNATLVASNISLTGGDLMLQGATNSIRVSGTVSVPLGRTISVPNAGSLLLDANAFNVFGSLNVTSATTTFTASSTLTNNGTATFGGNVNGNTGSTIDGTGAYAFHGVTIDFSNVSVGMTGGTATLGGDTVTKTLTVDTADSFNNLTINNANGVNVAGTRLSVNGTATANLVVQSGNLTPSASGVLVRNDLAVAGGGLTGSGGSISVGRNVNFTGAVAVDLSSTPTTLVLNGATAQTITQGGAILGDVTIINTAAAGTPLIWLDTMNVGGNLIINDGEVGVGNFANNITGNLSVANVGALYLAISNAPLHIGGTLTLNGALTHNSGDLNVDGNVTGAGTGSLSSTGGTLTLGGENLNFISSDLLLSGTNVLVLDGLAAQTLTLGNGGMADTIQNLTINSTDGASFGATTQAVTIAGALTISDPLLFSSNPGGDVSTSSLNLNTGNATDVLDVNGRNFTITGGSVSLTQGVLEVDGGTTNFGAGALTCAANASVSQTGGQIDIPATNLPLSNLGSFNSTAGLVRLTGTAPQTLTVADSTVNFTNLTMGVSAGGNVTLGGDQLNVSNDLNLTPGRNLTTGTTNVVVDRDILGIGSVINAATSTLIELGRHLDVAAYTPGALLRFTGTTNAIWTRAGGSNFGRVEISGNKTVSLSPASGAAAWFAGAVTVNSEGTLDMNGNPLTTTALTIGGASAGMLANGMLSIGTPVRALTVSGNVDLSSNSTVTNGNRIDLFITAPSTFSTRGAHTIFNTVNIITGGTVNGVGPFNLGAGGLSLANGNLIWDANDLTVAGDVRFLNGATFIMSPTNTLTIAPTEGPAGFHADANVIEGNLTVGGTKPVVLSDLNTTGTPPPSPVTVNGVTTIEAEATLRVVPASSATFDGPVNLAGTLDLQDDATFNAAFVSTTGSILTFGSGNSTFNSTSAIRPGNTPGTGALNFIGTTTGHSLNSPTIEIDLQSETVHDVINFGSASGSANLQLNLTGPVSGFTGTPITIVSGTGGAIALNNVAHGERLSTSDGALSFIVNRSPVSDTITLLPELTNADQVETILTSPGGAFEGETNPAIIGFNADPDGDGLSNVYELWFGTDPDNANAKPSMRVHPITIGLDEFAALDLTAVSAVDDLLSVGGFIGEDLITFESGTRSILSEAGGLRNLRFLSPSPIMTERGFGRLEAESNGVKPSYSSVVLADEPLVYWRMNHVPAIGTNATTTLPDYPETNLGSLGSIADGAFRGPIDNTGTSLLLPNSTAGPALDIDPPSAPNNEGILFTEAFEKYPSGSTGFTTEFWINIDASIPSDTVTNLVGDGQSAGSFCFMVYLHNVDGTLRIRPHVFTSDGGIFVFDSSTPINAGELYHIASRWNPNVDGGRLDLFINGVQSDHLTGTGVVPINTGNRIFIGRDAREPASQGFIIDEAALYNKPLSDERIQTHYQTGIGAQ